MFDVGFSEVLLLGIIALLVLGPERLPKAARIFGGFVRKARRSFEGLKQEIEREIDADEFKKSLAAIPTVASMSEQINAPFKDISDAIENERQKLSSGLSQNLNQGLNQRFDAIRSEADISADLMGEAPTLTTDDAPPCHPREGGDLGKVSDTLDRINDLDLNVLGEFKRSSNLGSRLRGNNDVADDLRSTADDAPPPRPPASTNPGELPDKPKRLPNLSSRLRGKDGTSDSKP